MIIELLALSPLKKDFLRAVAAQGRAKRARGGYICYPGQKPVCARTVMALQRLGLLMFTEGTTIVMLTDEGKILLNRGEVIINEIDGEGLAA